jgi:hypothetical protein
VNQEEQRVAIAEACGEDSDSIVRELIPDYLNDLNAMAEAEKVSLSGSTAWLEFAVNLMRVLEAEQMSELNGMTCILQATARQRAEAFLRTIGKWKE